MGRMICARSARRCGHVSALAWGLLVTGSAALPPAAFAHPLQTGSRAMFDEASMDRLSFLVGRWSGKAPDGSAFHEEYDRPDARTLRNRRFKDATFAEVVDGSSVTLADGRITSTWGQYTWRATGISDGFAEFEPITAPSTFSWRRVAPNTIEVTQRWTDEKGQPQRYALRLTRVR